VHERYRISGLRKTGEKQEKWTKTSKKHTKWTKNKEKQCFQKVYARFTDCCACAPASAHFNKQWQKTAHKPFIFSHKTHILTHKSKAVGAAHGQHHTQASAGTGKCMRMSIEA
jgi:hypothetical protein